MAISEVIEFQGSPDLLVWKHPQEDFNTTSQLIVDPTHEALLVLNGNAADLFGEGRHTLTTANIPFLRKIIEIPTGGKTAFPCKVYFINKVHQMDLLWGTKDAIPLEDPLYDIFLHVMIHGSLSYSIVDSRKFLLKLAGLRDSFTPEMLVQKFRGIVAKHVKDCVSKIMINGKLSYFMISANLMEISDVLQERLAEIFEDYGIGIEFFNVESISVPKTDYDAVSQAKERRTSRLIEGYTWQEERQMMIAEKFAANEGSMGTIGGVMGGTMGGIVMGNTISEVARNALSGKTVPNDAPPKDVSDVRPAKGVNASGGNSPFDVGAFLSGQSTKKVPEEPTTAKISGGKFCSECGASIPEGAKFCSECGTKVASNVCPNCGNSIKPGMKFCPECGTGLN
ncbi:MAG: SPFH domain-containing protein [Tyzzerella sp.]|nr:SPFH domain-containing protein [Tyzzerella sp.]